MAAALSLMGPATASEGGREWTVTSSARAERTTRAASTAPLTPPTGTATGKHAEHILRRRQLQENGTTTESASGSKPPRMRQARGAPETGRGTARRNAATATRSCTTARTTGAASAVTASPGETAASTACPSPASTSSSSLSVTRPSATATLRTRGCTATAPSPTPMSPLRPSLRPLRASSLLPAQDSGSRSPCCCSSRVRASTCALGAWLLSSIQQQHPPPGDPGPHAHHRHPSPSPSLASRR
mmetsp:Transcript_37477/g.88199  ORF Transcript_37477/g.88199 Transcript_37477/m.88199 type:complete len:244 (-) Transcript_37477:35-766(-)